VTHNSIASQQSFLDFMPAPPSRPAGIKPRPSLREFTRKFMWTAPSARADGGRMWNPLQHWLLHYLEIELN
jgi:hypothetical protein